MALYLFINSVAEVCKQISSLFCLEAECFIHSRIPNRQWIDG